MELTSETLEEMMKMWWVRNKYGNLSSIAEIFNNIIVVETMLMMMILKHTTQVVVELKNFQTCQEHGIKHEGFVQTRTYDDDEIRLHGFVT